MIKIEITDASTPFIIGEHQHFENRFKIGHNSNCSLIDPKCENFNLVIENDKLYIENIKKNFFYKVNGKKISGKKSISTGDEIIFSSIDFKVLEFEYKHIDHLTNTDDLYSKRIEESPELEEIFSLIEQDFIHLEKIKYDD
jgi:hypothetical protein